MLHTLSAALLLAFLALPPHPLNQVIGGPDGNQKPQRAEQVTQNMLGSRAFATLVQSAVKAAQDPRLSGDREMKSLNFGQRTRLFLARLIGTADYLETWQPSNERTFGSTDGPLAAHPLDKVLGDKTRSSDEVLAALRQSQEYAILLRAAAAEAQPLRPRLAGLNYAESVRVAVARAMEDPPAGYVSDRQSPPAASEQAPNAQTLDAEKRLLEGTWDFVFMQQDGQPKDIVGRRYTFEKDMLIVRQGDEVLEKVAYKLNPTTNPKSLHIDFNVTANGQRVGAHGIYTVDGNTLTVCTVAAILPQPVAFESKAGSRQWLVVMKRATTTPKTPTPTTPAAKTSAPKSPAATANSAAASDLDAIQGTWKVISNELNGERVNPTVLADRTYTFSGTSVKQSLFPNGTFKLDPSSTPKKIDLHILLEGALGFKVYGIYKVEGDKLSICTANYEDERPTQFTTRFDPSGLRNTELIVLQRTTPMP